MSNIALREGSRSGLVLSACIVVLAILGLTPSLSWIPEVPLVLVAVLLPLVGYGLTGFRAGVRSGRLLDGSLAGALAGCISGVAVGLVYVVYGKPWLNVIVGLVLGCIGGALLGTLGALLSRRRPGKAS